MGQKVNPVGLRTGINRSWSGKWFAEKYVFAKQLAQDIAIRKFLKNRFKGASISHIDIERYEKLVRLLVHSSRPGVITGKKGMNSGELEKELERNFRTTFEVEIIETAKPDTNAVLMADFVARQLEQRTPFRKAAKGALQRIMDAGAKGGKIILNGRLAGVEIARSEFFIDGTIPLHTFRANISYATERAETTYGTIGVKVWIYTGDTFKKKKQNQDTAVD